MYIVCLCASPSKASCHPGGGWDGRAQACRYAWESRQALSPLLPLAECLQARNSRSPHGLFHALPPWPD
ncbi:hypothetical protein KRX52_19655 [Pseudomonas sp. MAP12]|uniref:Uncharacterized protein n=1 Tax=Geopseudomonas aromaticivorans TaxID=2849492 RepID=A0ABS6N1R5_9GAMM|nr:hypothetical protein [Pseudomonas aromaticivorans]